MNNTTTPSAPSSSSQLRSLQLLVIIAGLFAAIYTFRNMSWLEIFQESKPPPENLATLRYQELNFFQEQSSRGHIQVFDKYFWNEKRREVLLFLIGEVRDHPKLYRDYQERGRVFELIEPTFECDLNAMISFGTRPHPRWLCLRLPTENCVVYSLSQAHGFELELAFLRDSQSKCQIHTFDCTSTTIPSSSSSSSSSTPNEQIHFHPWCIGKKDGKNVKRLTTTAKELRHKEISLMIIDTHGAEWTSIPAVVTESESKTLLPKQIAFTWTVNSHQNVSEAADFIHTIDQHGYRFAIKQCSRENDLECDFVIVHH